MCFMYACNTSKNYMSEKTANQLDDISVSLIDIRNSKTTHCLKCFQNDIHTVGKYLIINISITSLNGITHVSFKILSMVLF